jgi:hypothetical protein
LSQYPSNNIQIGDDSLWVNISFAPDIEFELRVSFVINDEPSASFGVPLADFIREVGLTPHILRELASRRTRSGFDPEDYPLVPTPEELKSQLTKIIQASESYQEARRNSFGLLYEVLVEMGYHDSVKLLQHPEKAKQFEL